MRYTDKLLLKLPDSTDYVQVEDLNENFTKIDTEIAKITDEETGVEAKLTQHLDESKVGAHKAKNIVLEDTGNKFVATEVEGAMLELFTNVSNGKQLVGTAITDVDDSLVVPTNPTFHNLADLIRSISTGYLDAILPGDSYGYVDNTVTTILIPAFQQPAYVKAKEVRVRFEGVCRVKMTIRPQHSSFLAVGKIYINGIPLGIERKSGVTVTTFLEDIPVQENDIIQVYLKSSQVSSDVIPVYCENLSIGINTTSLFGGLV